MGLTRLRDMHLNDGKPGLGSRLDRHANLGRGSIGRPAFRYIMNIPRLKEIPMALETANLALWAREISQLHALQDNRATG